MAHLLSIRSEDSNSSLLSHPASGLQVQDFTQAELYLYMEVVDNPNDLMLAGDTCQTIARALSVAHLPP